MNTHAHQHTRQHHEGLLEDHRTHDDMPAARTIVVLLVVLLAVFSVIASVIYYNTQQQESLPPVPTEQVQPPA
ncbi:MAG TPA: hypothetical protein VKG92_09545 [Flavobacteriales bacterium]|nr:hypothetical protein [Flavobacteriales bacterium]